MDGESDQDAVSSTQEFRKTTLALIEKDSDRLHRFRKVSLWWLGVASTIWVIFLAFLTVYYSVYILPDVLSGVKSGKDGEILLPFFRNIISLSVFIVPCSTVLIVLAFSLLRALFSNKEKGTQEENDITVKMVRQAILEGGKHSGGSV